MQLIYKIVEIVKMDSKQSQTMELQVDLLFHHKHKDVFFISDELIKQIFMLIY